MKVYRVPSGGWVAVGDRVWREAMGYALPEAATEMVRVSAGPGDVRMMRPEVWSAGDTLGCTVCELRGTTLVETVWSRIDAEAPGRWDEVIGEHLVEVPASELPGRAEVAAMLGERRAR